MERFEITGREILFSTIILCIMIGIGVWIQNPILSSMYRESLEVASSVVVDDPERFGYIGRTEVGNFIADGTLSAVDPVSIPDIEGQYMKIEKIKKKYTRHTRTVVTSDGKGHTHTRTEVYWSWDVVKREYFKSDSLFFLGKEFSTDSIYYNMYCSHNKTIYEDPHLKYEYYTHPVSVDGAMLGSCENRWYTNLEFRKGQTAKEIIERAEGRIQSGPTVFWIMWIIISVAILFLFFYAENDWLEDRK